MQRACTRVIVIYGAPAVGKLTVARHLSAITGYRVLHNHMTSDLVSAAIGTNATNYWKVVSALRLILIWSAVKNREHMIVTGCYSHTAEPFYRQLMHIVARGNGQCSFVHMTCREDEMYRRVTDPSRRSFSKTHTAEELKRELSILNPHLTMPFATSLNIDTTAIPPAVAAMRIAERCGLLM